MEIEEGHLPFLDIDIYRKKDGSLGHKVYQKPTHTRIPTTIQPTNNQSSPPWYTKQKFSVTKIPLHKNWNSSPLSSRKTDTAINRYGEP